MLGGPIVPEKTFFFVSAEGQLLNATHESHFAVPTVEQRGFLNSGATGITTLGQSQRQLRPTTESGNLIFSLFPFPNDPSGVFGRNTLTQVPPDDGRGGVFWEREIIISRCVGGRLQTLTARNNLTGDSRDLPVTGGGLFSSMKSLVRTDNLSTFLAGDLTDKLSNLFRFSWDGRDYGSTRSVTRVFSARPRVSAACRIFVNVPLLANITSPAGAGGLISGPAYSTIANSTEESLGAIGQVIIGGFSPVGADVFNFPQRRVNNTLQFADTLCSSAYRSHNLAFGTDIRHTELNSDLPRNSRPLVTFYGLRISPVPERSR